MYLLNLVSCLCWVHTPFFFEISFIQFMTFSNVTMLTFYVWGTFFLLYYPHETIIFLKLHMHTKIPHLTQTFRFYIWQCYRINTFCFITLIELLYCIIVHRVIYSPEITHASINATRNPNLPFSYLSMLQC